MVLHLGSPYTGQLNQAWELNSVSGIWQQRTTVGPGDGPFIFDQSRNKGLIFAYSVSTGTASWEWNGNGTITPVNLTQHPVSLEVLPGAPAAFNVVAQGGGTLTYQWYRGTSAVVNGGNVSGADTPTLSFSTVTPADSGAYSVTVSNGCTTVLSSNASLFITTTNCYANCDLSTHVPVLTANDFQCFLNAFVAVQPYANCDGSTASPLLTSGDFQCFLNAYAGGCHP